MVPIRLLAARAGAAGNGFAVVADEVRNPASKSAEAAKGTTALIDSETKAVVNGLQIADDTAKSLSAVVQQANEAAALVENIAQTSDAQSNAIAQITVGVDQISSVVQTNSATAEQSAAASEELSAQASMLNELVRKFKVKEAACPSTTDSRSVPAYANEPHSPYEAADVHIPASRSAARKY